MCRSKAQGGRRCPYHSHPGVNALWSARQAAERMATRLERAEARGLPDGPLQRRTEKLINAHERVCQREQALTADAGAPQTGVGSHRPLGPAKPTAADSITAERVNSMTWDEVSSFSNELGDDPEAWEKLEALVNEREAHEAEQEARAHDEEFKALLSNVRNGGDDPVSNPAARFNRKLTPHERVREEYECYVASQYFKAEEEVGFMLNKEGRAKGIDAYSLFSGPISRARKYGSEELQAWFGRNGRQTLVSYRYGALGWGSDAKAAARSRVEGFEHVANV